MSNIDKEWLQQKIADMEATRDDIPFGLGEDGTNTLAALRIALASLEAEPVGEVSEQRDGLVMDGMVDLGGASTHRIIKGASKMKRLPLGTKFYTAPPALASVPDVHHSVIAEQLAHVLSGMDVTDHQRAIINCAVDRLNKNAEVIQQNPTSLVVPEALDYQGAKELFNYLMNEEETNATVNGWNACRAAILQGAEPVQGWIPCSDRMPTKNDRVLIFINFNSDTVPPSIHDAQFTGSTFRRGNATVNVFPLEDGYGVTHWMPLPAAPQQGA